jgi:hypothetical protein
VGNFSEQVWGDSPERRQYFDIINVSREQVRDGQSVILIEAPDPADIGAQSRHLSRALRAPGQFIVTPAEAVELAVTLLNLAASQEMRLADMSRDSGDTQDPMPASVALQAAGALVNLAALENGGLAYAPGDQSPCCPADRLHPIHALAVILDLVWRCRR